MKPTRRLLLRALTLAPSAGLAGCITIGSSQDAAPHLHLRLSDRGLGDQPRRAQPLVASLLIQPMPADALADTTAIAYSRRTDEFAFYQLASWTERPVRALPRLLQRRLEASGLAGAVGLLGDAQHSDWLLTLAIDTLHHDLATAPGVARLALSAELFDRRRRSRVARRQFTAEQTLSRADSAAVADALSQAVAAAFDLLLPWLEQALRLAGPSCAGSECPARPT